MIRTLLTTFLSFIMIFVTLPFNAVVAENVNETVDSAQFFKAISSYPLSIFGDESNELYLGKLKEKYKNSEEENEYFSFVMDRELEKLIQNGLDLVKQANRLILDESSTLEQRQKISLSAFANLTIMTHNLLSIWKNSDQLEKRYKLLKQFRIVIPEELIDSNFELICKTSNIEIIEADNRTFYLKLNSNEQLKRELQVSAQIPSTFNYLKSSRMMTLQMILSQISLYQSYLGKSSEIEIPQSCQNISFTKLPSSYKFELPPKIIRDKMLENILVNNGLIAGTDAYRDYYLENGNPDLINDSIGTLLPFEQYYLAQKGIQNSNSSDIDDISYFNNVIEVKLSEMMKYFELAYARHKKRACGGRTCVNNTPKKSISKIEGLISDLVTINTTQWIKKVDGNQITINTEGLNEYIVKQMKERNITEWEKLIPTSLIKKLKTNDVKIDFPKKYTNTFWLSWALKKINISLKDYSFKKFSSIINKACRRSKNRSICRKDNGTKRASIEVAYILQNNLKEFNTLNEFTPNSIKNLKYFKKNYNLFANLWNGLRDNNLLTDSILTEWSYLKNQVNNLNPWAMARISYLIIMSKKDLTPKESKLLEKIVSVIRLDQPLKPFMGNHILDNDEKQSMWKQVTTQINEQNSNLFQASKLQNPGNYYDLINDVNNKNVFAQENVVDLLDSFDLQFDITETYSELKEIWSSKEYEKAEILSKLYKSKGNQKVQEQLVEILIEMDKDMEIENTDDNNDWSDFEEDSSLSEDDVKILFLDLENKIKAPIYRYLLQEAAKIHLNKLKERAVHLCQLDEENLDELKDLFYATSKAQEEINSELGVEAPEEIQDLLTNWNSNEKKSLWFGLGSAALFVGSAIVGGGCTVLSGGLCLPLTTAALASLATATQVYVAKVEFAESYHTRLRAKELDQYAELGLTDESNSEIVKRSYVWGGMEILFTIPLIGHLGRGSAISYKVLKAQAKGLYKGKSAMAKKMLTHSIAKEVNGQYSKIILGMKGTSLKSSFLNLFKGKKNIVTSKAFNTVEKITVTESTKEIDKAFGESVMKFFGHDQNKFNNFIKKFSDKEVIRAKKILKDLDLYNHPEKLSKIRAIWGKGLPKFKINQYKKFLENEESIKSILKEMNALKNSPREMEEFISTHADTFTVIFKSLPFQKKEIPHFAIALGGPAIRSRIPLYSKLAEVTVLKRIVSARESLILESLRESARKTIGISSGISFHESYDLFMNFEKSVLKTINTKNSKQVTSSLKKLEKKISLNIFNHLKMTGKNIKLSEVQQSLFNPKSYEEIAKAKVIWGHVPSDKIFNIKSDQKFLKYVTSKLKHYRGVNEFQDYLNALKVLSISKNPELINVL